MKCDNKFYRVFSIMLVVVLLLTSMPASVVLASANSNEFAGGSGTENDPYLIATKEHLNNVRNDLDAHYKLISDIIFNDKDFKEDGDYFNDSYGWLPIGSTKQESFSGVFDGNRYCISGLKINNIKSDASYVGLFGCNSGIIKNLTLICDITIKSENSTFKCIGGIVGYSGADADSVDAQIINCVVDGNIDVSSIGYICTGGIVGRACAMVSYPKSTLTTISSCTNLANIKVSSSTEGVAGGIAGDIYYYTKLNNCNNLGQIVADSNVENKKIETSAGGIVGKSKSVYSTLSSCYNIGDVCISIADTGEYNVYAKAGGIIGTSEQTICDKLINGGNISVLVKSGYGSNSYAGGIIGYQNSKSLSNSYNFGNIYTLAQTSSKVNYASAYSGGIVGYSIYGKIEFTYNIGDIEVETKTEYYSSFFYGGIIGYHSNGTHNSNYYLDKTYFGIGNVYDPFSSDRSDATKCSVSDMLNCDTYLGFDFKETWTMAGDMDYLYPELIDVIDKSVVDGDIDGDKQLTAIDALLIKKICVGMSVPEAVRLDLADINKDGMINAKDLLVIKILLAK